MEPAARIALSTDERIGNSIKNPIVKFSEKLDPKDPTKLRPIITIEIALASIGTIVPDSAQPADPALFVDGGIDGTNLLAPNKATVRFEPTGIDGDSIMTLVAELSTKIPGTGGAGVIDVPIVEEKQQNGNKY